jgi:flagellar assembly protein FliH
VNDLTRSSTPPASRQVLRRLSHQPAVPTTYASRESDLDALASHRAAAASQGYDEGYAEGLAKATADAALVREEESRRAAVAMGALARAVTALQDAECRLRSDVQAAAPRLAFELLEALLGREVELARDPGRDAIARVLALDEGTQPARVRLNPQDVDALGELGVARQVCVVPDAAVQPGGAVAEVGSATLDGQLETAVERVRQVLIGPTVPGASGDRAA